MRYIVGNQRGHQRRLVVCIMLPFSGITTGEHLGNPVLRIIGILVIESIGLSRLIAHLVDLTADKVVIIFDQLKLVAIVQFLKKSSSFTRKNVVFRKVYPFKFTTTLIVNATITVLKTNESIPCINTNRRILFEVICISDTWKVIPITKEK